MIRIINPQSWHSLLYVLRNRPEIYLGSKSLRSLHNYIDGFLFAERIYEIPDSKRFQDFNWTKFEEWVRKKTKKSLRSFMIPGSPAEAFDKWLSWYDEYNQTDGKEDYKNWEINNKERELQLNLPEPSQPWLY